MIGSTRSKKRYRPAEFGIGSGSIPVINEGDGRNARSGITFLDSKNLFREILLCAQPSKNRL